MLPVLNIIGCGKVGKTLARLWTEARVFHLGGIINRSYESAARAVEFIGAGTAVGSIDALPPAAVVLIATPDGEIASVAERLANHGALSPGTVVFHCSAALPSSILALVERRDAVTASVHPMKSFADPRASIESFRGTYCGAEGNPVAIDLLGPAFESVGGIIFGIQPQEKVMYHAATVIVCNYLVSLLEWGGRAFEQAGLSPARAFQVMEPLVRGTVDNVFRAGTVGALTGPIERGDAAVVRSHIERLSAWNPEHVELYRRLGSIALELAEKKTAAPESLLSVRLLLKPGG